MPNKNIEEKVEEFKSAFECKSERCSFETPHLHQPNGEIEPILDFLRQALLSIAKQSRNEALREAEEKLKTLGLSEEFVALPAIASLRTKE